MFRLYKLAAYSLLGYALYEFVCGLTGDARPAGRMGRTQLGGETQGRPRQRMTGPGQGERGQTQEASGGSSSHTVGRGVVQR